MKKKSITLPLVLAGMLLLAVFIGACSNDRDNPDPEDDSSVNPTPDPEPKPDSEPIPVTVFTAIGDVPYDDDQKQGLDSLITLHNEKAKSSFVFHVGDIKKGVDPCDEQVYQDVSTQLKNFTVPTFIIPGDNEYNDCENPVSSLDLWRKYFLNFQENWNFEPKVYNQEVRPENLMWKQDQVLFIGLHIVGGLLHDEAEWEERLSQDAAWVQDHFSAQKDSVKAAVVFGHANMVEAGADKFSTFTDIFRQSAKEFNKPVLHIQGDGHFWFMSRPYDEHNILRLQIDGGKIPVEVKVNPNEENPFSFDKAFLN